MKNFVVRCAAVLSLLLLMGTFCLAQQSGTSNIHGIVTDPQGNVVPGARVTITNTDTNAQRVQTTNKEGSFRFDLVQPGDYRVEFEAPSFKKSVTTVHALVANPTEASIQLSVGNVAETVTVVAEGGQVQINTQDSSLGNTFVTSQITQLPLESRSVLSLLTLQPGVTSDGYVSGARSDQSNITLDGVNINDPQSNSVGSPVLRLNSEAIDEFRVNTVSANAANGRGSGAQVALVTKGGTNKFHGAAFESHRNTIFTANDWFNNDSGTKRPVLLRNTFGGALGGPVIKDKLFFFYSFESRHDASSSPASPRNVPLPSLGQGIVTFKKAGGGVATLTPTDIKNIFPDTGGENPAAVAAIAAAATAYPANDFTVGDSAGGVLYNVGGFRFNASAPVRLNSHVARLDYNLSSSQTLNVRANALHDHDFSGLLNQPQFPNTKHPGTWNHSWGMAANHTWTISNNVVNKLTYGYTRYSASQSGDTTGNFIRFRFVFSPVSALYDSTRVTPQHNIVDDLSWTRGNHTLQFGVNFIAMSNLRNRFGSAYDNAVTNPSFYKTNLIMNSVNNYLQSTRGYTVDSGFNSPTENAITALLGRYTQYTASFTYGTDGKLLAPGTPSKRNFATQGYEGYVQDSWKATSNLTLTAGVRYSLWRPVYEKQGFEVQPNIPLGEYWDKRVAAMKTGTAFTDLISVSKSGPANGGKPMYNWDKTVLLPKVAFAWSPHFSDGIMGGLFGRNGQSAIRGGWAITSDYFGPAIATFFDERNSLGFSSKTTINANTYNVGCGPYVMAGNGLASCTPKLGPLFTDFNQSVRTLPNVTVPGDLVFPQAKPAKTYPTAIESSLDSVLQTPRNYLWSLTYERQLPAGMVLQASYVARLGRHLLSQRDIATPANLTDPKSGMDWYTAATILEKARQAGTPAGSVPTIPYFENLFPGLAAAWGFPTSTAAVYDDALFNTNDWTTTQLDMEPYSNIGKHPFYQPQYGALTSWTTIANSNYNAFQLSLRERAKSLTIDFNYTYSHSLDDASGLQTEGAYSSASLILNPLRQRDNYAASDFDLRHVINVNSVIQLPFGRGHKFAGDSNGVVEAIIGGWQVSNIFRWNTGAPLGAPYDANTWSTNWENQSQVNLAKGLPISGCPNRSHEPKFFGACGVTQAYQSFRNSYPGETGLRNYFRLPGYIDLDLGIAKSWKMPWSEGHALQFRGDVFNISNTQHFNDLNYSRDGWGVYPGSTNPAPAFSNFVNIQGTPRVMQFGLRYSF